MILHFDKVIAHNFSCYRDAELPLCDMGYTIVSGKNNNTSDNAVSNGSGKSSIFNAICYALTGETTQGLSNNVENIYTDPNDCWVELHFRADDDEFIIRRYKTPKVDLKIFINGEDRSGKGVRESQALLNGYIPDINSQLLGSIIVLGQGLPYRFTYNTPGARKFLLEKLTKSDYMVQTVKDKLELRKEELKLLLRNFEDEDIANKTQTKIYFENLAKLKAELNDYEEYLGDSEGSIDDKILEIKQLINNYNLNLINLDEQRTNITSKVESLTATKLNASRINSNRLEEKLVNINKTIDNQMHLISDLNATEKSLSSEIKKLDSVSDVCPTCGQKICGVHKIDTTELKAKLKELKSSLTEKNNEYSSLLLEKTNIIKDHDKEVELSLKDIDRDIDLNKKELNNIEKKITNITSLSQSLEKEEVRLTSIQTNYLKLQDEIIKTSNKLEELKESKNVIDFNIRDVTEHINVVQSLITLAKREFRSVLLENVVKYMDKKAKEYSREVFGAELISIITDENYINVIFNNKYYEALSGGEKQKIDIIIQLALRDLLSNQLNIHSNLLVLDEIFDNLDLLGCQKIIDLISKVSDIESMFIISHHVNDLQISYDSEVIVEKSSDGVSSIFIK